MAQKKAPELRFLLHVKQDGDYGKFVASVVYINEDGNIRNPGSAWKGETHYGLADFEVTAQADLGSPLVSKSWYGWHAEFNPFRADLPRAEAMVKTLRKVQRHLDKVEREEGYTDSLALFLARVADALRIERYGILTHSARGFYDKNTYRWVNILGAATFMDEELAKLRSNV